MKARLLGVGAVLLLLLALVCPTRIASGETWLPFAVLRLGDVEALEAEDGSLAGFVKRVRNDGRFPPPVRTLVGPAIRNPTLYGLAGGAWIEWLSLIPSRPGRIECVWAFPVDNHDDYLQRLAESGLSEYEGMDGGVVLREAEPNGDVRIWHLEWLPGDVAVFGSSDEAVSAAAKLYRENGASRGLLAEAGGRFVEPDAMLRVFVDRLAAWQDVEPGRYWLRRQLDLAVHDFAAYWQTAPARTRLMQSLSDDLAAWVRGMGRMDFSLWFEDKGVEWRFEATGDFGPPPPRSQLEGMRRLPERTAMAYSIPVTGRLLTDLAATAGRLLMGAAGGASTAEARETALSISSLLSLAGPRQMAAAWIPPPTGRPELGTARMLVVEWGRPEMLDGLWRQMVEAARPDSTTARVFSQMGWDVAIAESAVGSGSAELVIRPAGNKQLEPYCDAVFVARRNGAWMAVVGGSNRDELTVGREAREYRAGLAAAAAGADEAPGTPDVRNAFTRMGPAGASCLGFLDPVLFAQLALAEEADWRPRSPDQAMPSSTRLAREMLEYASGEAWTMSGEAEPGTWRFNGGMSWRSLIRLAGALGVTEAIGME